MTRHKTVRAKYRAYPKQIANLGSAIGYLHRAPGLDWVGMGYLIAYLIA